MDDEDEISNRIGEVFEDLSKAGFYLLKSKMIIRSEIVELRDMDVQDYLCRKNIFNNKARKIQWLKVLEQQLTFDIDRFESFSQRILRAIKK